MAFRKCARRGCPHPAREGRTECAVCAAKRAVRWQRLREREARDPIPPEQEMAQSAREDARALQWLRERGYRAGET
jgi:hypothetical protein